MKVWLFGIFADCCIKKFDASDLDDLKTQVELFIKNNPRWKTWKLKG